VIHLVRADGGDPLVGILHGRVTIQVRQLDMAIATAEGTITREELDAIDVPITSFGIITRIEVTIEDNTVLPAGEGPILFGASPPFAPIGVGDVSVVVGAPGTCEPLVAPQLSTDRAQPALVSLDANLFAIGGEESDGTGSTAVDQFSPVQLTETPVLAQPPAVTALGPGGAMRLGTDGTVGIIAILALSEARGPVLYYLDQAHATDRDVDLRDAWSTASVHLGAGPLSALVDLGDDPVTGGIAIVGGRQGDAPSDGITWVDINGLATTSTLASARVRPAAVRIGDVLLIAGGQAEGEPLFETVSVLAGHAQGERIDDVAEQRFGPVLARDPGGNGAWLGFGEDADGVLLASTYAIAGCPSACRATPSSPLERPRRGFATALRSTETLVIGGADDAGLSSSAIDRVRFASGVPIVEPLGELHTARQRPGATHVAQGVVLVAGGQVERGGGSTELRSLRDFEICFPEALDEL
jgi:hypothetical protein